MVKEISVMMAVVLCSTAGCAWLPDSGRACQEYVPSEKAVANPLMGYAPPADSRSASKDTSLVYIDITWRELEPQEGVYDWSGIEEENHMEQWREEGKHAVLRFVCDKPSKEAHMDIPDWLYEKTSEDGTHYDMAYGRGYSPNYGNPVFISAHEKAICALGERYGSDTFISFVELGSLGHWGEWHVKYDAGIQRIPLTEVREKYVLPYIEAFPNAKILMRRPFTEARRHDFGVYNDMAGDLKSTEEWLDWIENGGTYHQTGEDCIEPVPDVWSYAPVGGEFTSGIEMEVMMGEELERTVSLIRRSHTTFLGPKVPSPKEESLSCGRMEVLRNMGYRIFVSRKEWKRKLLGGQLLVTLTWKNEGVAPFYWDWPVYLYKLDSQGNILKKYPVDIKLTELSAGGSVTTKTKLPEDFRKEGYGALGVGIEDPMTGLPAVQLTMECAQVGNIAVLESEFDEP